MVKVRLTGRAWNGYLSAKESTLRCGDVVDAIPKSNGWDAGYVDGTYVGTIYSSRVDTYGGEEVPEEAEHPEEDVINHPSHYTSDPSGVECIQITRHRNFNVGNAFKYLWRNGLKDDPAQSAIDKQIEDLGKAKFHIDDEIERLRALKEGVK